MKTKEIIGWFIATVLILDMCGATAWALTGQTPQDGFYIGAITNGVIYAITK